MKQKNLLSSLLFCGICLLFFHCQNRHATQITFLSSPDDSGTLKEIVKHFNDAYKGEIRVKLEEGPRSSTAHYNFIHDSFEKGEFNYDVFASDVVWTASMANLQIAEDLSSKFYQDFKPIDFLTASLNAAIYHHNVWGIPWFTDAGLLYYRKDLLSRAGFEKPPETWEEMIYMANKIMEDHDIKYAYTFQGAQYEGGLVNACEFIWNAGGNLMIGDLDIGGSFDDIQFDPNIITINSAEAVQGLTDALTLVKNRNTPEDIYLYLEKEATDKFLNNETIFMRNWPGVFGQISSEHSKLIFDQVGIAPIPVSKKGQTSYSCLGGWNLMINSNAAIENKEASWVFIQYLVDSRRQKYRAMVGGNLPSLRKLYEDSELLEKNPIMNEFKHIIQNARSRPNSPYYKAISPIIAELFNQLLRQEVAPEMAVFTIEKRLEEIFESQRSS